MCSITGICVGGGKRHFSRGPGQRPQQLGRGNLLGGELGCVQLYRRAQQLAEGLRVQVLWAGVVPDPPTLPRVGRKAGGFNEKEVPLPVFYGRGDPVEKSWVPLPP